VINERVVVGYGKTMPAKTPLSETISNAVRKRGFQFVGPVIVYAWMQAVGIVNDHETQVLSTECHAKAEMTHVLPNN
jgi:DNA-3-methyladenine glycosylase I